MLFIRSNSFPLSLPDGERLRLLKTLAARGLNPLVRSTRYKLLQSLAGQRGDASQLEAECASLGASAPERAFTPGELFCAGDCVFYLTFGGDGALGAGVIYDIETAEPLPKLERFCRDVREALGEIGAAATQPERSTELMLLQPEASTLPTALSRFMALQPADFMRAEAAFRGGRGLARASELMEGRAVRAFLRSAQEMRREGFTPRRLFAEAASHLVAAVTGAAEDEGRMRLYEFAWRRARDGRDLGMTLAEGLGAARAQIEAAFEMAVRRELTRRLFGLDAALGFSAAGFVLGWFRLMRASDAARQSADVQARVTVGSGR